jgi:hypothetical protein
MEHLLRLISPEQIVYAAIAVMLPTIVGFLLYLKGEKDAIVEFVVDEVDDVLADLNQAKLHVVNAIEMIEDSIEGLLEGLSPESLGGTHLTDEEKQESILMANKALSQLKMAKDKIAESVCFND